jgi:CheY-like chemotaxis protein
MQQKQKTVLVVDDDQGTRDTLTAILRGDFRRERVGSRDDRHLAVSSDQGTAGATSGDLTDV